MALTHKRRAFTRKFVKNKGNGTKSYRDAGFAGNDNVCAVEANRLLRNPKIVAEIKRIVEKEAKVDILSAQQVLSRLTDIADADLADVLEPDGSFDLSKAKERGKSKLIKSVKFDKDTGKIVGLEIYSAHEGQRDLGKFHKLFTERVETTDTTDSEANKQHIAKVIDAISSRGDPSEAVYLLQQRFADKTDSTYDQALDPTVHPEVWPDGNLLGEQPPQVVGGEQ